MAVERPKKENPTGHSSSPEARKRAMKKYAEKIKNNYQRIQIRVPNEKKLKEQIEFHIAQTGESMATFITRAVNETINKDCMLNGYKSLVPRKWEEGIRRNPDYEPDPFDF